MKYDTPPIPKIVIRETVAPFEPMLHWARDNLNIGWALSVEPIDPWE